MNGQHNEMNGGGNVQPNEINGDIQPNEINGDINPIAINGNGLLNVDIQPNVMNGEIHPININGNVLLNVDIHPNEMNNNVLVNVDIPLNLNQNVLFHDMNGNGEIHEINNGDIQPPHEENNDDTEEPDSALSSPQNDEMDPEMKTVGNNNDSSSTDTSSSTMTSLSDTLFLDKANDDSGSLPNDQENPEFPGNYGRPEIEDIGSDYEEDYVVSSLHSLRQIINLDAPNTSIALAIDEANSNPDSLPNNQEDLDENPEFQVNSDAPEIEDIGSDYEEDYVVSLLHSQRQTINLEALNTSIALAIDENSSDSVSLPNNQNDIEENPENQVNYGPPEIEDIGSDYEEDLMISPLHSLRHTIDLEALNTSLPLVINHVDLINLLNEENANEKANQHAERTDQANKEENVDLNGNIQLNKRKTDAKDTRNQENEVENNGNDQKNKDKNDNAGDNDQAKEETDNVSGDGDQGGF